LAPEDSGGKAFPPAIQEIMNIRFRIVYAILVCMLMAQVLLAQEVQWASSVISFSSELSPREFAASRITGKPDVLPVAGDNPNAWMPANPNGEEFILVGFDKPQKIQQIAIAESFNPTAIYQIFAYDSKEMPISSIHLSPGR
jgi:OmpA-OmpF porin, OOP family